MASFADVQYCIYADIVAGSEEFQNYADVINGWFLREIRTVAICIGVIKQGAVFSKCPFSVTYLSTCFYNYVVVFTTDNKIT